MSQNPHRIILALLSLVLVLIAAVFIFQRQRSNLLPEGVFGSGETASIGTVGRAAPASVTQTPVDHDAASGRGPLFDRIDSLAELINALSVAPISGGQRLAYERRAVEFCDSVEMQARWESEGRIEPAKMPEQVRSRRYLRAYAKEFCNSPRRPAFELMDQMVNGPSDDEVLIAAALGMLREDGDVALAQQQAEALLLRSKSPDALFYAALSRFGFLSGAGTGWKDIDGVPRPPAAKLQDLLRARMLAINRLQCDLHGGCGPDGFYSVVACSLHGNCRSGITAEIAWREAYPPELLAYANAVYQELVRLRSAASVGGSAR